MCFTVSYCCNKTSNQIVTRSKELVFYSWIPLSPEVSRLSPYAYAQQHTRTSRTFYIFAVLRPFRGSSIRYQTLSSGNNCKGGKGNSQNSNYSAPVMLQVHSKAISPGQDSGDKTNQPSQHG